MEITEAVYKSYVDSGLNDPSVSKKTAHVDLKDENLENFRSVKVNSFNVLRELLTARYYVMNLFLKA